MLPLKSCYPHIPSRNFLRIQCKFFVFIMEILIFIAKIWDSKIYDVYRTGTGTVPENCSFFLVVSEPVSEKIGTRKKSRNRYR